MNFLKRLFSKKEARPKPKKSRLKNLALKKLRKIEKIKSTEEKFNKFVFIFRIFIKKSLRIKNQFTHNELIKELEKRDLKPMTKRKITNLSLEINKIEFANQELNPIQLEKMFKQLREIIEEV